MRSNEPGEEYIVAGAAAPLTAQVGPYPTPLHARPVWVRLDAICIPRPNATPTTVIDGLIMTGEVPGRLHHWLRAATGEWLGCVSFEVHYIDGRDRPYQAERQLVPAYALRRRR